jgi:hypothetical protein
VEVRNALDRRLVKRNELKEYMHHAAPQGQLERFAEGDCGIQNRQSKKSTSSEIWSIIVLNEVDEIKRSQPSTVFVQDLVIC